MTSLLTDGLAFPIQKGEENEHWREIPGYEGLYEASDCGRIRTCEGKITSNARYPIRIWKQRILKQKIQTRTRGEKSDARVSLWKNGKEKTFLVSRLVGMAWCDGYDETLTINHIDGNPLNNHAKNLEWTTMAENVRHGFETGLIKTQQACSLVGSNGDEYDFDSESKASRFLGRNSGYLNSCLKYGRNAVSTNGEEYNIMIK